ncbi:GntR family transcriptional regulator [Meiothermus sp. QL-1]|uniref:GntR family transcriptional regulator n=1 Tax=Meiothermus sp. QL-1 TaxID=2058095 RepID=UPI000E09FBC4|nr:GntR family transcriptional regulator [Meiothermus sp. QL-1]RDI95402.1 GntR family transcriptional regulator [Meiothermus sp. QL-1]
MTALQRPRSLREAAYIRLREDILQGLLPPGTRILEPELAQSLGVSRTPVREALQRLAQEGLVELVPGRGARVRVLLLEEVREVYEVRALLEGEAAALAAERASQAELGVLEALLSTLEGLPKDDHTRQMQVDLEFHTTLVAAAHHKTLARIYEELRSSLALVRGFQRALSQHPTTQAQHRAILAALKSRDPERAAQAARAHVFYFRDLVAQRLSAQEEAWT